MYAKNQQDRWKKLSKHETLGLALFGALVVFA
ncbi:predicted protein [Sclerotinia sclerotiorum 1980 UF-70]|uniref:Uncharacterized protein n=1 Tax=Sclerotinia sclerotiorum (strain ATCC 18683 / 1980 / Ss-1) TaxID=665079 RepID=A7EZJ8_SCLS1|nr:predicted protein [Sclerotinia sclerotiorum 1980 UF-70]EDN94890.1 predicted protein [Sclerotinia sclerotiorum 1980 UF-70]